MQSTLRKESSLMAVSDIAIGDLNSDGVSDIIIGSPEDGVRIFFRENNSTWSEGLK